MTHKSKLAKTTALTLAASIFAGGLLPLAQASAHERHAAQHGVYNQKWSHRTHRKFHKHYGRGNNGTRVYTERYGHRYNRKRKKSDKGDLVAAGVIGLALGAIIASEANKNNRHSSKPSYQYDAYRQPHSGQRIQLDRYGNPISQAPISRNQPDVITYQGSASLEPWSQGWREWCSNRYRSFNPQTGTFRGYDGFDHFCVPK